MSTQSINPMSSSTTMNPTTSALMAQVLRNQAAQARQDPTAFQANDPFAAYLLSLSDPAAIAEAALTGLASSTAASSSAATTANLGKALAATAGTGTGTGTDLASAVTLAAALVRQVPALSSPAAVPDAATSAAATDTSALLLAAAQAPEAQAGTLQAEQTAAASANANADAAAADTAARVQADAAAAQNAANAAPAAATTTALAAVLAADTGGVEPWSQAVDATAKFMGAGVMAQMADGTGGLGAGAQPPQEVIPAVNGVNAAPPMAANTYSNPQERAFGQSAPHQPLAPAFPLNPAEGSRLDITS